MSGKKPFIVFYKKSRRIEPLPAPIKVEGIVKTYPAAYAEGISPSKNTRPSPRSRAKEYMSSWGLS